MKVALVHDWLTGMRGGERCLEAFLRIYPNADIFTLVHVPGTTTPEIDARVVGTSFLNRFPKVRRYYRALLPLYPAAARSFDFKGYDLVISLSHAAVKNIVVPKGVPHVCYCFTPMRYIWDQAPHYFRGISKVIAQPLIQWLRSWDRAGAERVTHFVAISRFIAARVRKYYGRRADVIAPPVRRPQEVSTALSSEELKLLESSDRPFFLCAGALVPYKRIDVAVQAFSDLPFDLLVIGDGPERSRLEDMAGPNVRFLGRVSDAVFWECYRRCRALVFPGVEDFGIVPVECLASGRPVIGVDAGGLRDTIVGARPWLTGSMRRQSNIVDRDPCGVFIPKQGYGDPTALAAAVRFFVRQEASYTAEAAKQQALHFSYQEFFSTWAVWAARVGIDPGSALAYSGSSEREGMFSRVQGARC